MDLRDSPSQQLRAHIDWIRERFGKNSEPPSPQVWEELCKEQLRQALFAEAFLLPDIVDPTPHLPSLQIIRGVGAGAELVHPQERQVDRLRTYNVNIANGSEQPEPEPEPAEAAP